MKGYRRFSRGFRYCLLNALLVLLMVFLLFPTNVSRVEAKNDNTISGILPTIKTITEEISPDSDNVTPDILPSDDITLTEDPSSDNSTISNDDGIDNDIAPSDNLTSDIPPVKITVKSDNHAQITSHNGKIKLYIPEDAVKETIEIELLEKTPSAMGPNKLKFFELNAFTTGSSEKDKKDKLSPGNDSTLEPERQKKAEFQFEKELTLSIQHTEEELAGLDLDSLHLYHLDEETGQWVVVPSAFDRETLTLNANITHFSYYGEQANPLQNGPGRVMASQVDLHSGTSTYSYPLELPPGPGGFKPSLTLNYNSGSVDGMKNKRDIGSWVGIGWSLHMGRISRDLTTDEYFLDLNGVSYKLVTTDNINYHTQPEQYFNITRNDNVWEVRDRDGVKYVFGGTTESQQYVNETSKEYYRWDLSQITDTNGNSANISYYQEFTGTAPNDTVRSAYPVYITYGNNTVQFITGDDGVFGTDGSLRYDNPISVGTQPAPKLMETRRLDAIEIISGNHLLRKYTFGYTTTNRVYSTDYSGGIYYSGYMKLDSITQYGADGTSSLPPTGFTYENKQVYRITGETQYAGNPGNPASIYWPFLTAVNSGYGGCVGFTYTQIPNTSVYNLWTRQAVTQKTINSSIGTTETYTYAYTGNPHYCGTVWDQQFRGWNEVKETDAAGNYVKHFFYTTGTINGKDADKLTGKEYKTEWCDSSNNLLNTKTYDWDWIKSDTMTDGAYIGSNTGGTLSSPVGVAVAPDGSVYVASAGTNRIVKYDANLNYVNSPFDNISISSPKGIAISKDGYLFVVSGDNYLRKYDLNGVYITAASVTNPYGVAVSDNNVVFVSCPNKGMEPYYPQSGTDSYILKYNAECQYVAQIILPFTFIGGPIPPYGAWYEKYEDRPYGLAVSTDGYLYAAVLRHFEAWSSISGPLTTYTNYLKKYNASTLAEISSTQYGSSNLYSNIAVSENGNVYYHHNAGGIAIGDIYYYKVSGNNVGKYSRGYNNWNIQLQQVDDISYNASSGSQTSRTGFVYDGYGNVITQYQYGDISTGSDNVIIHREFYPDTSLNILSKVAREWVTDASSNTVKETIYYYDENAASNSTPTRGNLTKLEQKVNAGYSVNSTFQYDPDNGNMLSSTDPNGNTTNFTYDATGTYFASRTLPNGLFENYTYEWNWTEGSENGTVKITATEVSGNHTISYYDTLDRICKLVKPGDSYASPSVEYRYNSWGIINQQNIETRTKISEGNYLWQKEYFDGLGRVVQVQNNGENGETVISSTTAYNNRGMVDKQYVPIIVSSENINGYESPLPPPPPDLDWLEGWQYRKQMTVDGSTAGELTNYQLKLNIYKGSGPDLDSSVYLNHHVQPDFADIRFTKDDGETELDYWVESYVENTSAVVWVEFDSIPADSTTSFYVYYGNDSVSSESNGDDTFAYFDDFLGDSLGPDWNVYTGSSGTSYSVSGGILQVNGAADGSIQVYSTTKFGINYAYRAKQKTDHYNTSSHVEWYGLYDKVNNKFAVTLPCHNPNYGKHANYNSEYATSNVLGGISAGNWSTIDIIRNGSTDVIYMNNDANTVTISTQVAVTDMSLFPAYAYLANSKTYADWVLIRKYIDPEPTFSAWGSEEAAPEPPEPQETYVHSTSTYDALGRVVSQTNADNTTVSHDYSAAWADIVTGPNGHKTRYSYDAFNRLANVQELYDNGTLYAATTYTYDALGNLKLVVDSDNNTTSMDYDWLSRKVAMQDPDMGDWSYGYDNNGNLITQTDAKDQTITMTYDALNRLTGKSGPGLNVSYTYDQGLNGKGRRTSMVDAIGTINYKYDARGRLTEEKRVIESTDYTTYFAYDGADRNTWIIYPGGEAVEQTYNGRGLPYSLYGNQVGHIVTNTLYNQLGAVTEINLGNGIKTTYGYYGTGGAYDTTGGYYGRLWEIHTMTSPLEEYYLTVSSAGGSVSIPGEGAFDDYDSGAIVPIVAVPDPGYEFVCWTGDTDTIADIYAASTNITMNGNFSISAIFSPIGPGGAGGTVMQHVRYTWDAGGNLVNRYDILASETETFTYDHLDRLTGVSGPYEESYTYNTIGNIMSRNGIDYYHDYYYDDPDHAHAVTSVGTKAYAYDANGNMTYRDGQTLAWDIENRLISVSANATTIAQFFYDGDGNRVKKIENGETILYINKYYEVNLTTSNDTSYYYLGGRLAAMSENATLMYVHQDHLTSTSLMTDSTGVQLGTTVKYLPFGETRSGSVPTDKLFTGQRLDSTGLYYYNARYYDPLIGRFISPDTIVPNPANPQSFNRYSYCLNNPLKYLDPTGRNVEIAGLGDVTNLGLESLMWMLGMTQEGQQQVMAPLEAYTTFKESSAQAAHMAWTMEQSPEHTVTFTSGTTTIWAETTQTGDDYTVSINSDAYTPYGLKDWEQGNVIFEQVDSKILNTQPDYDIMSAVWDQTLGEITSLNGKVDFAVGLIEFTWNSQAENPALATLDAIGSCAPGYDFFSNLVNQKNYYDNVMRLSMTPYPFRDN